MKNLILIALVLTVPFSCRKPTSTNGGHWTLNSQTYNATQAYWVQGGLVATTGTGVPTGSFTIWFRDSSSNATVDSLQAHGNDSASSPATTWPPKLHSYILCSSYPPTDSGYAFIQLTDSSQYNSYTITGSTTPSITVSIGKNGLATVTIPPVMVVNTNGTWTLHPTLYPAVIGAPSGTDSSLVSGVIIQTQ